MLFPPFHLKKIQVEVVLELELVELFQFVFSSKEGDDNVCIKYSDA